ncbi:hypothetical protein A3K70_02575 [Candidatus Bathyarchaeota archaeon RBG_16_48_13]|nr:MAG: hypothetical protein A3K70_02575 [Candidatus Bathyarchaeota archaeon RBG_16_48_13]
MGEEKRKQTELPDIGKKWFVSALHFLFQTKDAGASSFFESSDLILAKVVGGFQKWRWNSHPHILTCRKKNDLKE